MLQCELRALTFYTAWLSANRLTPPPVILLSLLPSPSPLDPSSILPSSFLPVALFSLSFFFLSPVLHSPPTPPKVKLDNPEISQPEVMKKCGAMWKALGEEVNRSPPPPPSAVDSNPLYFCISTIVFFPCLPPPSSSSLSCTYLCGHKRKSHLYFVMMSFQEKKKYEGEAAADKERYTEEMKGYPPLSPPPPHPSLYIQIVRYLWYISAHTYEKPPPQYI